MNKKEKFINNINPLFLEGICHRGYWNKNVCENSLKAFKNALDINMPIEFDIHVTKDDQLVVFHDEQTKRVTGKEGIIEDLTLKEIKENYRLLDGQEIPTLKEVFDLVNEKIPMVIELKTFRRNGKHLANTFKKMLPLIKDKKNIILISFDPRALTPFKHSGIMRQLLLTTKKKYRYIYHFKFLFEGIDIQDKYTKENKIRKYSRNHFINVWTIEDFDNLNNVLPYVDTVTFQHMDASKVREILRNKNKEYIKNND